MKIIDDTVFAALQRFYRACGSQRVMGAALGLSRAQVSRVLRRKTASFEDETWERIPATGVRIPMGMPFFCLDHKQVTTKMSVILN